MTSVQHNITFGRQILPHTVIIARGEKVRHFTVRPWVLAVSTALVSSLVVGCFGAATYLVMRDDLLASGTARQARLQYAYEDRIASLRSQLDRAVSRQLLDQQKVETKVDALLGQQVELTERYEKLRPLLDRARSSGLLPDQIPVPQPSPGVEHAALEGAEDGGAPLAFASDDLAALARFNLIDRSARGSGALRPAGLGLAQLSTSAEPAISHDLIRKIGQSIDSVEDTQLSGLSDLADSARAKAAGITSALSSEGIRVTLPQAAAAGGEGGPFVPVPQDQLFEARVQELDTALTTLQSLSDAALLIPIGAPVGAAPVSSTFGVRADPFLGQSAMHTGIDFVALSGTTVGVTASGTVILAGPNGGYGNMVEVDHGNGVTTRYAHLSSILVTVGDKLKAGDAVGKVGSTGRSTGPHLHYEVRHDGTAVDPARFLRAGRKISALG